MSKREQLKAMKHRKKNRPTKVEGNTNSKKSEFPEQCRACPDSLCCCNTSEMRSGELGNDGIRTCFVLPESCRDCFLRDFCREKDLLSEELRFNPETHKMACFKEYHSVK